MRTMPERSFPNLTDAYKQTHHFQYPPDLEVMYSYMEPRNGAQFNEIVWCGLQFVLKEYGFIDSYIDRDFIEESSIISNGIFGKPFFNYEGWEHIKKAHGGNLPINIYALPEGTIVKPGTPVLALENTDPKVPWLTNYVESLLMHCYAMTNTATISHAFYKTIKRYCDLAGEDVSPVHLNDFGLRGASSLMSAEMCGIGHLLNFIGTDNNPAIDKIRWYYHPDNTFPIGVSVVAAEHSTITSWGKDHELEAYRHIIETTDKLYGDDCIISLVIDSYDWKHAINEYFCKELKSLIMNRKGRIVCRPDSGSHEINAPVILQALWDCYGGTINDHGYKVLDPHISIIIGDGVDIAMVEKIYNETVIKHKFAPSNIIFGCGGNLLQNHNRDTNRFAMKCSAVKRNGVWHNVNKTTPGKESKAGRFDNLPLVYSNGKLLIDENISDIRKRVGILI